MKNFFTLLISNTSSWFLQQTLVIVKNKPYLSHKYSLLNRVLIPCFFVSIFVNIVTIFYDLNYNIPTSKMVFQIYSDLYLYVAFRLIKKEKYDASIIIISVVYPIHLAMLSIIYHVYGISNFILLIYASSFYFTEKSKPIPFFIAVNFIIYVVLRYFDEFHFAPSIKEENYGNFFLSTVFLIFLGTLMVLVLKKQIKRYQFQNLRSRLRLRNQEIEITNQSYKLEEQGVSIKTIFNQNSKLISILSNKKKTIKPYYEDYGLTKEKNNEVAKLNYLVDSTMIFEESLNLNNWSELILLWTSKENLSNIYRPENIDLNQLIVTIALNYANGINMYNIDFYFYPKQKYFVFADRVMLNSLLRNIFTGIIKFPKLNCSIFIQQTNTCVDIFISNIDVNSLSDKMNVFTQDKSMFKQLDNKCQYDSYGFDLCTKITNLHNSKLFLYNQDGEKCFHFSLSNVA